MSHSGLCELPKDLLRLIGLWLDVPSLKNLKVCCMRLRSIHFYVYVVDELLLYLYGQKRTQFLSFVNHPHIWI